MTTTGNKINTLAAYKAAQYAAIVAKGASVLAADWGAYADAIAAIPTGTAGIPASIANAPFEPGAEPTGGTVWYVRPDGTGLKDGTSWDNAFATRAEAVASASSGDRVYIMEGKYRITAPQAPKVGVSEYYGFPADDPTWANRQPFLTPSRLDAGFTGNNFNNAAYVFLEGQVIDGLWIENVVGASGVNCTVSSNLRHCVANNCTGATYGGGMYLTTYSTATNCTATNCTATYGGGFYCSQAPRLYNCVSWGDRIYLATANYAYQIYNCASNFPLTGVSLWSNNADIQGFLDLSASPFPFAAEGQSPFDGSGAFFQNLPKREESLAFIESDVFPNVADLHLPTGSPLIGAGYYGAGVTPATDADGKTRPVPPSIGAYEP